MDGGFEAALARLERESAVVVLGKLRFLEGALHCEHPDPASVGPTAAARHHRDGVLASVAAAADVGEWRGCAAGAGSSRLGLGSLRVRGRRAAGGCEAGSSGPHAAQGGAAAAPVAPAEETVEEVIAQHLDPAAAVRLAAAQLLWERLR